MRTRALLLALGTVLLLPAAAQSQKITPGQWTGTLQPPGEEKREFVIDVAMTGDSVTAATLKVPSIPDFPGFGIETLRFTAEGKISMKFFVGMNVTCLLDKQEDASFAGPCTAEDGSVAPMTLASPKPKQ